MNDIIGNCIDANSLPEEMGNGIKKVGDAITDSIKKDPTILERMAETAITQMTNAIAKGETQQSAAANRQAAAAELQALVSVYKAGLHIETSGILKEIERRTRLLLPGKQ